VNEITGNCPLNMLYLTPAKIELLRWQAKLSLEYDRCGGGLVYYKRRPISECTRHELMMIVTILANEIWRKDEL